MKYRIISVGRANIPFYRDGIREYMKRLGAYTVIELVEGLEEKINARAGAKDIQKILDREGRKILDLMGSNDILVVLDSEGKQLTSQELAALLGEWNMSGKSRVNFLIGSSHGLSPEIKKQAHLSISFSKMTFPHQMAVLMLTEQLYRGFKILKGEKYHK